jgi:prevent-host-death family protein
MKAIPITEFKAKCLRLIEEVNRTGEPIEVTKHGKPMVKVSPSGRIADWTPGRGRHTVDFVGDVESSVIPAEQWESDSKWF